MKKILALLVAVCLIMSLAIPAFATEVDTTAATTEATTDTTAPAEEAPVVPEEGADDAVAEEAHDHDHDHDHETETTGEEEPESGFIKVLRVVLTVLEVLASIVMVVVVLMQSGKEAGLSGALSGSNSDSYMNKSGMGGLDKTLAKATKWVALAWIALTLALSLI